MAPIARSSYSYGGSSRTRSNATARSTCSSASGNVPRITVPRSATRQRSRLASISAMARASRSTNVTAVAPRLRASSPSAPVPAQASRTAASATVPPRMLNSVSRSRSDVGRRPGQVGDGSRLPFSVPLMMRIPTQATPVKPKRRFHARLTVARWDSLAPASASHATAARRASSINR